MKQVSVEYTGPKNKISIRLPVGVKLRSAGTGVANFTKGKPETLSEVDALELCHRDINFRIISKITPEKVVVNVDGKTNKISPKRERVRESVLDADEEEFLSKLKA